MGCKQKMPFPSSVYEVVVAICMDYARRKALMDAGAKSEEVKATCARLNEAVDAALNECEPWIRVNMLNDIINRRGYDKSVLRISKSNYYYKKRIIIQSIATRLNLI